MPLTPVFMEAKTGDDMAPELEKAHGGVTPETRLTQYVDFIGRRLLPFSPRADFNHTFKVLDSVDIINAFALGNGNVYVTKGLLYLLDDEAELAEIVGHEMGHVASRHIASRIDQTIGLGLILGVAEAFYSARKGDTLTQRQQQLVDAANSVIPGLVLSGFSREDEYEADSGGLSFMSRAGYEPQAAVRVFEKFKRMEPEQKGIEIFFRSHPWASDRVVALQKAIAGGSLGSGQNYADRYRSIVRGGSSLSSYSGEDTILGMSPVTAAIAAAGVLSATFIAVRLARSA